MLKPILVAACLSVVGAALAAPPVQAQAIVAGAAKSDFIRLASSGDMYEIESSKLALAKADNAAIKKIAQMLISDHTALSKKLMSLAGAKVPPALGKKHADMLEKLKAANGAEFTKLYIAQQIQAHKEAIDLFERYAKAGDDVQLKSFATETLPRLRSHLQEVQKMQKS